ncbi:MAG: efflux RND transporter periplasmic adaptor subunit [Desulfomicrobium sp.]|nr:efflux RND transporter periplasmic adaptor subunit [Desulfomicrobium sp.]
MLAATLMWFVSNKNETIVYMTEEVTSGSITRVVSATGEIGAVQLVTVGAQVSGQIKKLHVIVGQDVKKGDLLAELDSVKQVNQLETDRALLEAYQAQLEAKNISLRMAQSQYERAKNLLSKDAASEESLENLEDAYALAKAEVKELKSSIRQTELALSTDELDVGYTRITAPLDGVVVSVPVDEGQTVNSAQTTPTIVQIADLNSMEIKVEISEGDITAVKAGLPISYTILSEPDEVRQAVLTSIDPGLTTLTDGSYNTSSSGSGSSSSSGSSSEAVYYYGKAIIDNSDGRLRIGMTAQIEIAVASAENTLTAPLMSVTSSTDGKKTVRVLDDNGTVHTREVTPGINDGIRVQILRGLDPGEKVITGLMSEEQIKAQNQSRRPGPF